MKISKKKIIMDSLFSILATSVPIIVLQMLILPIIARVEGSYEYGLLITLVSLSTVLSAPFGNVLNNMRLLLEDSYIENGIEGDFNYLLLMSILINSVVVLISLYFFFDTFDIVGAVLLLIISTLNIIREYFLVGFRLELNYKLILNNNLVQAVGYCLGLVFYFIFTYWQVIYITGLLISIYFIFKHSNLHLESFKKTRLFKNTLKQSVALFFSVFLKTFLTYADRLLLFPLLGAGAVSVYYSSSIIGKILSMAIMPLSGVLLSYLRKMESISKKVFIKVVISCCLVAFFSYYLLIIISDPVLLILYPEWYQESLKLIPITTVTALVMTIASIIHPIVLRFRSVNWQIFINTVNLVSYIICIYIFFELYGLYGFCLGILISNLIKLLSMILVYLFADNKKEEVK